MADHTRRVDTRQIFVREIEKNDGHTLSINQFEVGDVGCVVWDAALVLLKYMETADFDSGHHWHGKRILELGAGTGVVGIQAATLGGDVTITDLEEFVPLMQMNIEANSSLVRGKIEAKALKWKDDIGKLPTDLDYVLCADCIYYEESLDPLVETISASAGENTIVLCCYEQRTTGNKPELERKFFELIREQFMVDEVALENQDPLFRSEDIHIMRLRKKPDPTKFPMWTDRGQNLQEKAAVRSEPGVLIQLNS